MPHMQYHLWRRLNTAPLRAQSNGVTFPVNHRQQQMQPAQQAQQQQQVVMYKCMWRHTHTGHVVPDTPTVVLATA